MTRTPIAQLKGPKGNTGAQGLPGVNAVANDTATAGYIQTTGVSDTRTALTLFDPKGPLMRAWTSAAAAAGSARANVVILGDSIGEGAWSTNYFEGFPHVLRKYLQTAYAGSVGGEGFIPTIRGFDGLANGQPGMGDQWQFSGAAATLVRSEANISGLGRRSVNLGSNQTATHTFFGDRFRLHFTGYTSAGNAKVIIDGGSPILAPTYNATTASGVPYTSPQLARGQHTVAVSGSTGAIVLDGGCFWDGDYAAGVTMWDASHSSFRTDNFDGHDDASTRWSYALTDVAPHLVIIELGTNDEHQPESETYSPEIYGQRLGAIVDLIRTRAVATDPSIAFLLQPTPGAGGGEDWWLRHRAAAIATAAEKGVALIDLKQQINHGPEDNLPTKLYFNANHPNTAGHRAYAKAIASQLGVAADIQGAPSTTLYDAGNITVTNAAATDYAGPDVYSTVDVPASGRVLVTLSARIGSSSSGLAAYLAFGATGANTIAASGTKAIRAYGTDQSTRTMSILVEGLTPGVTRFDALPFVSATNTGTFSSVSIIAEPR